MTPRQLKAWRERLDLSQYGLARWLGVSRSTVNRWEGGLAPIPKMVGMLAHRGAVPVVDDLRLNPIEEAEIAATNADERRVHVGYRRAAGDRRVNRFSPDGVPTDYPD